MPSILPHTNGHLSTEDRIIWEVSQLEEVYCTVELVLKDCPMIGHNNMETGSFTFDFQTSGPSRLVVSCGSGLSRQIPIISGMQSLPQKFP